MLHRLTLGKGQAASFVGILQGKRGKLMTARYELLQQIQIIKIPKMIPPPIEQIVFFYVRREYN